MPANSGLSPNVVQTALDKVFMAEFDYPRMPGVAAAADPVVFQQDSNDNAAVIVEQYQGVGYFGQRAEQQNVPEATSRVGNQQTHSVLNFSKGINISKNFFDDEQHSVVQKIVKDFASRARLSQDQYAFDRYNLGFTTVTANDGVALFSNAHVRLDAGAEDNLETAALTPAALETLFNTLITQLTQDGTLGGHEPAFLLVPPALFKEATEITQSEQAAQTADNELNYYSKVYPGLQVKMSPFLSAGVAGNGSDTAYFLGGRNHSMYRWVRQPIETALVDWRTQGNNNYIYKAEYREVVAPIAYDGLAASNGTT